VKRDYIPLTHPLLKAIGSLADSEQLEVYVVGGFVRDALLGLGDRDLDILVLGDGIRFAERVARELGRKTVVVHEKFGTATVPLDDGKVEFVGARREQYEVTSRRPQIAVGTLEEDLLRRDFTVNALAASLNKARFGELLDPCEGRKDLGRKLLRTPMDPLKTFDDDSLRSWAFRSTASLFRPSGK
jgi:tRNA nucleotidyltransferase/poly(A) polymerase